MVDNIIYATDSIRSSVSSLKKKLSNLKISIEQFDSELDKIEIKFDKLLTQTEIYKAKVEREVGRDVRRLENEITRLKKQLPETSQTAQVSSDADLKVAATIGIFECILRHAFEGAEDLRLMSYAFLFPAVYERAVSGDDPAYLLDSLPATAKIVVNRGKEYVSYIRKSCETHVTDPEAWNIFIEEVTGWWKNDALPLIYGNRDEQWDEDVPLTLMEILIWRDEPAERPLQFPRIYDGYEIYRNNKDHIFESSGIRTFDLKEFSYSSTDG